MHKAPGISELESVVHTLNAALEHCPPATRAILEGHIGPVIKRLEMVLAPVPDKDMEHG